MLREFWNFHNDIAIPLEGIARRHYGDISRPVTKWMMENGWKTEIRLGSLLEGLTNWQFEQAEAMTNYFTHQRNVKNETVYHILLANMKRMSISEFVEKKEIIVN